MEDLKPYLQDIHGQVIPCCYFKPKKGSQTQADYVVEKIVDHKIRNGIHLWRVRWKGYGENDDTWEPASSFVEYIQDDSRKWNKENGIDISLCDL